MKDSGAITVTGLIDLAAQSFGGKAIGTSDDFFAGMENLLLPGRGVFVAERHTENGKWMDGWESRRKRTPGHDWCILELGVAGKVQAVDIDTNHFLGNNPAFASVDALWAPRGSSLDELVARPWTEILGQVPLKPGSQNICVVGSELAVSHLRLNIFPDGGVARFRAYGKVSPDWAHPELDDESRRYVTPGLVDLAAAMNGAVALAASDSFFAPMNNLLMPGRTVNQDGGWETRRRRGPGNDWMIVQLGARGTPSVIELDTLHFKGNFPHKASIEGIDAPPGARVTDLIASGDWSSLLEPLPLGAHNRHFFDSLRVHNPITHLRLSIYPDGGLSRLRVWGRRELSPAE
ncbi:MAG: allantoicase [Polyangiaceae bacterium]